MKPTTIFHDPTAIDRRLAALGGLDRESLLMVVEASYAAVGGCTENDPPAARGWECWRAAIRRLREMFRSRGWDKDDSANFSTILNKAARIKVAVANTDGATGDLTIPPTNRSKKGSLTDRASEANQGVLPFAEWSALTEPPTAVLPGFATWYLCIHIDGERVRAELSLPVRLDNGFFSEWTERIILIGSDDDWPRARLPLDDDHGPYFDVSVVRR